MTPILSLSTLSLSVLVLAGNAIAVPTTTTTSYPEVIPGPGFPSLAQLGLTSAQLYTMGLNRTISSHTANPVLEPRWVLSCGSGVYCDANDAVACINYINAMSGQSCIPNFGPAKDIIICTARTAVMSLYQRVPGAVSSCRDVARGGGDIMDHCTQSGLVAGDAAAYGNGDLIVYIFNSHTTLSV